MSPIDTGCRQKRRVCEITVPKDWWDIARDQFFCNILIKDLYPVNVDKLSKEHYKEAHQILNPSIKNCDILEATIHTVSIPMSQALLSTTDNKTW